MKAIALKTLTLCLLILLVFSCKKEEENLEIQLTGKWSLTEKSVDNIPVTLSACEKESYLDLQEKNQCVIYNACSDESINSGWNYKDEMLNISEYLPAAFYIEQLDNTSLKLKRNDISSEGNLQVTFLQYSKNPE